MKKQTSYRPRSANNHFFEKFMKFNETGGAINGIHKQQAVKDK